MPVGDIIFIGPGITDADTLDGQHGDWYQDKASAINASNIANQTVLNATKLNNQPASYYATPGTVAHFAMNSPPSGWVRCNGAELSRSTYSALFAAIGTTYGVGNNTTTFNVPDLRGEFLRGFDDGRGVDNARVFGTAQLDELKSHTHTITTTEPDDSPGYGVGADPGGDDPRTYTTTATGGIETRPRNVAMLACIKF